MKRSCARVSIGRKRGFGISIPDIVIVDDAIVPAIITAMMIATKRRDTGAASTSSAMRTYGGLQSDSQATATTIAASWRDVGAASLTIARSSSAEGRNAATIVSASADHDPKRNSAIGSSATASKCARNAGAARQMSATATTAKHSVASRPAKNEKYGRTLAARDTAAATICGTYVAGEY